MAARTASAPRMASAASPPFQTPIERLAAFFDIGQPRNTFADDEIDSIALLLEQCGHVAHKCPRTYILFRTIGHLDKIEALISAGFCDQWFPVEARSLPSTLEPSIKAAVVQQQGVILTKSLDLENGRHRHFAPDEALPFDILGRLGSGGYGQVDRILSKTSFRQYALKRIRRRAAFGNSSSREAVKGFLNEMKIMRGLEHRHVVQYVGSYTDKSYLGLVMSPVADTDLATYNERLCDHFRMARTYETTLAGHSQDQSAIAEMSSNLRTYFGCLTAALIYLHDQNIRHKDVKPQNILVAKGNILFTDFGLSRDFGDDVGSTTSGLTPASPRYCAPEVASYEARNTSSDIWSLGCVFLEMTAALRGLNIGWIKDYFAKSGSRGMHFHTNYAATVELIQEFKAGGDSRNALAMNWIEKMLLFDRGARPTAASVMEMITLPGVNESDLAASKFCGICCVPDYESDSMDSLAEDFDDASIDALQDPIALENDAITQMRVTPSAVMSESLSSSTFKSDTASETTQRPAAPNEELQLHTTSESTQDQSDPSQTAKQVDDAKAEISRRPDVFGVPISLNPAKASRSTGTDFGIAADVYCYVPVVVAECCTFLIRSGRLTSRSFDDSSTNDAVEQVGRLVSVFDTYPTYGRDHDWGNCKASYAGSTLYTYLRSLPEALIPASSASKLLADIQSLPPTPQRFTTGHPWLRNLSFLLRELPRSNRCTVLYFLGFSMACKANSFQTTILERLATKFHAVFLPSDSGEQIQENTRLVHFMMLNAQHILQDQNTTLEPMVETAMGESMDNLDISSSAGQPLSSGELPPYEDRQDPELSSRPDPLSRPQSQPNPVYSPRIFHPMLNRQSTTGSMPMEYAQQRPRLSSYLDAPHPPPDSNARNAYIDTESSSELLLPPLHSGDKSHILPEYHPATVESRQKFVIANKSFTAELPIQLSFGNGDVILLVGHSEATNWFVGELRGKQGVGVVPAALVSGPYTSGSLVVGPKRTFGTPAYDPNAPMGAFGAPAYDPNAPMRALGHHMI